MKLLVFLGTRPEIIKLAPLIAGARQRGHEVEVVFSGQHASLAEPLFDFFNFQPRLKLDVMQPGQSLLQLSHRLLRLFQSELETVSADFAVVQGDTTTAFLGSYWAFLRKIPAIHVEAGLRTYDLAQPFPEEANRQLIARLASLHFAPTANARLALLKEAIPEQRVFQIGNTGIDALLMAQKKLEQGNSVVSLDWSLELQTWCQSGEFVLVTAHRRENFGAPLERIARGVRRLLEARPKTRALIPIHPNPQVAPVFERHLGSHPRVRLVAPLHYLSFLRVMKQASLILTDSGGVQEEAPTFGKRLLVLRDSTERPEGVEAGFAQLVGSDPQKIEREGVRALSRGHLLKANPYGDGQAATRILDTLEIFHLRREGKMPGIAA